MARVVKAGSDSMYADQCIFLDDENVINLSVDVCSRGCALNSFIVRQPAGCCCFYVNP